MKERTNLNLKKPNKKKAEKLALIAEFLRGSKTFFLLSVIFIFLSAGCDMLIPQIIRCAIDNVIVGETPSFPPFIMNIIEGLGGFAYLKKNIWIMAISIVIVALLKVICQYCSGVFNARGAETLSKRTRDTLFSHIARLPYSWYKENHTGDIIQRCTSDVSTMNEFLSEELIYFTRVIVLLVFSTVVMFRMNWALALIALGLFPVIIINSILFDKRIEKDFRAYDEEESKVSAMLQENLSGARVVRAFGKEKCENEKFKKANDYFTKLGNRAGKTYSYFTGVSRILLGVQVMLVVVVGAIFCMNGKMTAGEYIAFLSYNILLSGPLNELGVTITELGKTNVSVDRIYDVMKVPEEGNEEGAKKPPLCGDITFENVSFSYEDGAKVLDNISFSMKGGTTLGILGGTGSGKSTLIMLLDKIYPLKKNCGKISISGVDLREIDTQYLRKNTGVVLQDSCLFSRTIAENIAITKKSAEPGEIDEVVRASCLKETIDGFKNGLETYVGEKGVTLSGGQKQRVAIARVLIKNSPIIIFDDSLSAVDTETDIKIRKSIEKLYGKASVIIVSHRISTLSKADKIIVLEKGRITQEGTHNSLKEQEGLYKEIYDIQSGGESYEEE